jgi:hypothetical protein
MPSPGTVRTLSSDNYNVLSVIKPGANFKELTFSCMNKQIKETI